MNLNKKIDILLKRRLRCPVPIESPLLTSETPELSTMPSPEVIEVNHVVQSLLVRIEGLEKRCEILIEMKDHLKQIGIETPAIESYNHLYENEFYRYNKFQKLQDER